MRYFWKPTFFISYFIPILTWGNASQIFLAEPNDPYLEASFSRESELEMLLGQNVLFLNGFTAQFAADFDTQVQYEAIKKTKLDIWEMQLFAARNAQMEFLKKHSHNSPLSEEFRDYMIGQIEYNYWHLLLAHAVLRGSEDISQVASLPSIMLEMLDKGKIDQPKRLISKSYRQFLPYFVIYFSSGEQQFRKYTDGLKSMADKALFAEKHLGGDVLDYTLTQLLVMRHQSLNISTFQFWSSQIHCENLRNYLKEHFFEAVSIAEKEQVKKTDEIEAEKSNLPIIIDLDDKPFTFDKFKGKVIYVDFWASWCGPCRAEFPHSRALYEGLSKKQKEEIVFLYVSIEKNLEKWKEAVEKFGLNQFGENGHSFAVSSSYLIHSIPRYMIINKKGEIVSPNAPRPRNPETLDLLLGLLD